MLEDISFAKVEDVAVAVIPERNKLEKREWYVYILNLKEQPIESVLIRSKGYGEVDGKNVTTSTLRQYIGDIPDKDYRQIEPIQEKLFQLCNEFWVSFRCDGQVYDKKYVFVPESITQHNFIEIPLLQKEGVMIK